MPLMNAMARPGTAESFDLSDAHYSLEPPSPTRLHGDPHLLRYQETEFKQPTGSIEDDKPTNAEVRHLSGVTNTAFTSYPASSFTQPEAATTALAALASPPAIAGPPTPENSFSSSDKMLSLLLPGYPTTEAALEGVTILSATVMRRMPMFGSKSIFLRSGSVGVNGTPFRGKAPWQTHQLLLTSLRLDQNTPEQDTSGTGPRSTQTIAFLHLFGHTSRSPVKPGPSVSFNKRVSPEVIPKVEVERMAIGPATTAGVWENDDTAELERSAGRKWVLKVKFAEEQEEWLCDMPTG